MSSSLSGSDNQNAETRPAGLLSVREKNFELMDSLYKAAVEGHTDQFRPHAQMLDQILTPNENTILHIHITGRPNQTMKPNNKLKSSLWRTMSTFEKQSSSSEHFVRDILEMCPGILRKANTKGKTLLHIAARHGHADIVKDLISECKKPHQHDPEKGIEAARLMRGMTNEAKDTALHEAVRYNQVDVVKILTKEDPNLPYDANKAGETPLYLAAERGYKDVMGDILSTCISPADHGPMGRTALHAAVSLEDTEMTKMLLNKGTPTSKPDQQGCLPLHLAAHFGRHYNVKELLKADKSAAYKADNEGKVPLHLAADWGNLDSMRELMFGCPSPCELVDGKGWNVFHFALNSESRRAVELLLENPSLRNLINEKNDDGNTPLLEHAASGSYCVKSFFLHPKVDRLAFNHQNNNIEDIFRSGKAAYQPRERLFLQYLNRYRCRRHMFFGDRERKDQGNNNVEDKKKNNHRKDEKSSRVKIMGEYVKERNDPLLVIAVFIATITFTAGQIAMPDGDINERYPGEKAAILTRNKAFAAFVTLNSEAMILSTCAVFIQLFLLLLGNKSTELLLWRLRLGMIVYALAAMLTAFLAATYSVLCVEALESIVSVICFLLFTITMLAHPLVPHQLINFIEKMLITFCRSTKEFIFPRVH